MMNPLAGPAGPGKFSTRTDKLELGSTAYGEGVEKRRLLSQVLHFQRLVMYVLQVAQVCT
jgi:hypothetical protein